MPTFSLDRRQSSRTKLSQSRRRMPRLGLALDAFYESDARAITVSGVELSLRGAFVACFHGDPVGTEGILRIALPEGPMIHAGVVVIRQAAGGRQGMALRFCELSAADRFRLAAHLLRTGGLSAIPALEARFDGWARMPNPAVRRELRHTARRP
jgi:hypothetical protein